MARSDPVQLLLLAAPMTISDVLISPNLARTMTKEAGTNATGLPAEPQSEGVSYDVARPLDVVMSLYVSGLTGHPAVSSPPARPARLLIPLATNRVSAFTRALI